MRPRRIVSGVLHGFALVVALWLAAGCAPVDLSPETLDAGRRQCEVLNTCR